MLTKLLNLIKLVCHLFQAAYNQHRACIPILLRPTMEQVALITREVLDQTIMDLDRVTMGSVLVSFRLAPPTQMF